jgi:hypothetical protein
MVTGVAHRPLPSLSSARTIWKFKLVPESLVAIPDNGEPD